MTIEIDLDRKTKYTPESLVGRIVLLEENALWTTIGKARRVISVSWQRLVTGAVDGIVCHMIADTEAELHAMAARIGVARRWCQGDHYDRAQQTGTGVMAYSRRCGWPIGTLERLSR
jgi:hypothetical protein